MRDEHVGIADSERDIVEAVHFEKREKRILTGILAGYEYFRQLSFFSSLYLNRQYVSTRKLGPQNPELGEHEP